MNEYEVDFGRGLLKKQGQGGVKNNENEMVELTYARFNTHERPHYESSDMNEF